MKINFEFILKFDIKIIKMIKQNIIEYKVNNKLKSYPLYFPCE